MFLDGVAARRFHRWKTCSPALTSRPPRDIISASSTPPKLSALFVAWPSTGSFLYWTGDFITLPISLLCLAPKFTVLAPSWSSIGISSWKSICSALTRRSELTTPCDCADWNRMAGLDLAGGAVKTPKVSKYASFTDLAIGYIAKTARLYFTISTRNFHCEPRSV